ncbi:MAG: iron-sulfur cluster assembly scaffold protein [Candidatus Roizmanbacteria bacterium]
MSAYPEHVMDHYRHPRNNEFENDIQYTCSSGVDNPSCGDKIQVKAYVTNGVMKDVAWEGVGCALSTASASIMTEKVKGKLIHDILGMTKDDVLSEIDMKITPTRLPCALISLEAIQKALRENVTSS